MGRRDRIAGERLAGHLQIVNLCFHGIGIPERELEPGEDRYWVTVERFEELMALVAGERSIRLTFDDGNASDLAVALPVLSRYGLRAQFFVVAGRLGQRGSLPAEGLRTLVEAGMSIGSHGMQHRSCRSRPTPAGWTGSRRSWAGAKCRARSRFIAGWPRTAASCGRA